MTRGRSRIVTIGYCSRVRRRSTTGTTAAPISTAAATPKNQEPSAPRPEAETAPGESEPPSPAAPAASGATLELACAAVGRVVGSARGAESDAEVVARFAAPTEGAPSPRAPVRSASSIALEVAGIREIHTDSPVEGVASPDPPAEESSDPGSALDVADINVMDTPEVPSPPDPSPIASALPAPAISSPQNSASKVSTHAAACDRRRRVPPRVPPDVTPSIVATVGDRSQSLTGDRIVSNGWFSHSSNG